MRLMFTGLPIDKYFRIGYAESFSCFADEAPLTESVIVIWVSRWLTSLVGILTGSLRE